MPYRVAGSDELAGAGPERGGALIGFIQTGTGAVERTVQAKLRETVSVLDYHSTGIVGVNTSHDTSAINAAIDTGLDVFFPAGHYSYTPNGKQLAFGQSLFGTSPLNTTINKVANGDMFVLTAGCGVRNISLQGNGGAGATGRGFMIGANSSNITLSNVNCLDMLGYGAEVIADNGGSQLRIIGGVWTRTDPQQCAMRFPSNDTQATPRSLVGIDSTGWLVDTNGCDTTLVIGCYSRNMIFGANSKKRS